MRLHRLRFATVVMGVGLLGAWGASSGAEPKPPVKASQEKVAPKEHPPAQLRAILRQQMSEHGGYLLELVSSVLLLQYEQVQQAAQKLASQPRLAAPVAGSEGDLNALLPRQFLAYQDQLRQRARAVGAAAARKDDAAMGVVLGHMMQTCVSCHALYLRDAEEP